MAEDRLITIVDVDNPDDDAFGYVKTIPRSMTEDDLEKMKPVLKKAGAYKFFKMDFNFSDGPAVREFLDSVNLEDFKRAEKLKFVQDDLKGTVAGKKVVINADLVEKAFGLVDDGLNISRPNKKSHDLHMFYIKPVYVPKCSTKRGINLKHFKSEFSYIPNFARQVCAYCTGLMSEGYINFSQYRAVDSMIRKKPVNWNRYLLQNFQDRFRKFRATPFDLYFGGTLTALIYKALGIDYSILSTSSKVPRTPPPPPFKKRGRPFRKNVVTSPRPLAVQHPSALLIAEQADKEQQAMQIVKVTSTLPSVEPGSCSETPVPLAERTSLRASTLKKRKAFPPLKSRKGKVARRELETPKDILQTVQSLDLKVKKRRGRAAPPRPVTMGKLELLTRFSHRAEELDAEMQDKLTTMYYTASGIKPRRKADVGYKGSYTLSTEDLKGKCEKYYALEEELLLEHMLSKTNLEKAEKRFKELKRALIARDREIEEKASAATELEDSLKSKEDEILALKAELEMLKSSTESLVNDVVTENGVDGEVVEVHMKETQHPEAEPNEVTEPQVEPEVTERCDEAEHADKDETEQEPVEHADEAQAEQEAEVRVKETEHRDEAEAEVQMKVVADEVVQVEPGNTKQGEHADKIQLEQGTVAEEQADEVQMEQDETKKGERGDEVQMEEAEEADKAVDMKEAEDADKVEADVDMNEAEQEGEQGEDSGAKEWRVVSLECEEIDMEGLER